LSGAIVEGLLFIAGSMTLKKMTKKRMGEKSSGKKERKKEGKCTNKPAS
jgi:hypothetical protein